MLFRSATLRGIGYAKVKQVMTQSGFSDDASDAFCRRFGLQIVRGAGSFAKYTKVDSWLKGITNATSKANVENIIKNWSDDLLTKLDNVPSRNPNFLSQVEANQSILNHFEDGASVISSKGSGLKPLELDMYALDKTRTTDIVFDGAGNYIRV